MKTPPIRLLEQEYDRLSVEARHDHRQGEQPGWELQTKATLQPHPERDRLWVVVLEVDVCQEEGRPTIPYQISVRTTGSFEVHPTVQPDDIPKLVAVTGTSILYSGLRELLAMVTARGPWGAFLIPTVSFADLEPNRAEQPSTVAEGP